MRLWKVGSALVLLGILSACGGSPAPAEREPAPPPQAPERPVNLTTESAPSVVMAETPASKEALDQTAKGRVLQGESAAGEATVSPRPERPLQVETAPVSAKGEERVLQNKPMAAKPTEVMEPETLREELPPNLQADGVQAGLASEESFAWEAVAPTQPERVIVPSPPRRASTETLETAVPPQPEPEPEPEPTRTAYELPVGTQLSVRLTNPLSTEWVAAGERFQTVLEESIYLGGALVLPQGTLIEGRALRMVEPEKGGERASLTIDLVNLLLKDENLSLVTNPITIEAPDNKTEGLKEVGGAAAVGTILGAIFGGKKGAAIGASVGAGAATVKALSSKGRNAEIGSEELFTFRLEAPLRVTGT